MPWIDRSLHVTFSPAAVNSSPEELEAAIEDIRQRGRLMCEQREVARKALEGLPYAAVPLDQLASIYKRFLRLTKIGQGTIEEWDQRSEEECQVRRAVFRQSDFGAVFAGQWLPRELRDEIRHLVHGKRYNHNFDQHEVAYHRDRLDRAKV